MDIWDRLASAKGFDWDEANMFKNWEKHQVSPFECEQVFFNRPLVVHVSQGRNADEERFYVLGKTDAGRMLFLVFTMRKNQIRIISARSMSREERKEYLDHE